MLTFLIREMISFHYFQINETSCQSWNETRCPNGVILPDYSDTSRVLATTFRDKVKPLPPNETTIYMCPVNFEINTNQMLYVMYKDREVKEGEIVISAQAKGIMHKIQQILNIGELCNFLIE